MPLLALVGMPGSGKSEVAKFFFEHGFSIVRFGDITDEELRKRNLPSTPENEQKVREGLRKIHGMDAYAKLNLPRIDAAREHCVLDGMRSFEEYLFLKEKFKDQLVVVAVVASPRIRHARLKTRTLRPLSERNATDRDHAEIENLHIAGPIALAEYTIINEGSPLALRKKLLLLLNSLDIKKK